MRMVGMLMFLVGAAGTAYSVHASFARARAAGALFGLAAPVFLLVALVGALLVYVPDFLG